MEFTYLYKMTNGKGEIIYVGSSAKKINQARSSQLAFAERWTNYSTASIIIRNEEDPQSIKFEPLEVLRRASETEIEACKKSYIKLLNPIGNITDYRKLLNRERNNRTLVRRCIEIIISLEKETEHNRWLRLKYGRPLDNIFDPPKVVRKSAFIPLRPTKK